MDFIFELPADTRGHTGILVFVCRLSKMVRLVAVKKSVTAPQAAQLFVDNVFRHHGLPEAFVSDRDPRFVSHFWTHLFRLLGTRLDMSTADHPQTDGQTERVNRVLEDVLRSICTEDPTKWSTLLPQVEFALNNAVHSSTGFTPFYVNGLRHPRTPLSLPPASRLGGGEAIAEDSRGLQGLRSSVKRNLLTFIETSEAVRQRVRDAMAAAQDTQKEHSDRQGRKNTHVFKLGDQVLLNAKNLPIQAVTAVGSTKLRPRFVGPFTVIGVHGNAYTLDLPSAMATHPTFYVGLLKPYRPAEADDSESPTSSNTAEGRSPSSASSQLGVGLEQPAEQRPSEGSDPPVRPRGHRAVGSSEDDPEGHRGPPEGLVRSPSS
uniref:Integrase catalytic domain-containing protein n=1 Tax=Phytophthora ramorum TaxID=164328 RepID=H3H7C4_PHYRM